MCARARHGRACRNRFIGAIFCWYSDNPVSIKGYFVKTKMGRWKTLYILGSEKFTVHFIYIFFLILHSQGNFTAIQYTVVKKKSSCILIKMYKSSYSLGLAFWKQKINLHSFTLLAISCVFKWTYNIDIIKVRIDWNLERVDYWINCTSLYIT